MVSLGIDSPRSVVTRGYGVSSKRELTSMAEGWLTHLRDARRLSTQTILTYRSQIVQAFRHLPDPYTPEDLQYALDGRLGHAVSAHTRRSAYVALSLFFRYWQEDGGPPNPLRAMEPPPKPQVRRRALSAVEQELLSLRLQSAALKDRCEVMLLLFQGFRDGDVVNLKVDDIDATSMTIRCRVGKGGRHDVMPMGPTMANALRDYLDFNGITEGYVFTGPKGKMTIQAVWKAWRRVAGPQLAGLAPHQLRHTYATLLLRGQSHADINTVRKLMRHRNLATTQLYLDDDPELERGAILSLDRKLAGRSGP